MVRSDKNEVLVFDGTNYSQIATLPTGNQPNTMAISFDQQYLLVGNLGSQIVNVFDLDTLQADTPIMLPSGFTALSIASSANATLAQGGYYDGTFHILQLDIPQRTGTQLPTLGVFTNLTNANTVLTASQNGSTILIAQADGTVYLYDATANSFTVSRQDFTALAGPYAASAFNQYVVGNNLLDSSLVPVLQFETGTGSPSGFAFVNETGFRSNAPPPRRAASYLLRPRRLLRTTTTTGNGQSTAPGVMQRIDMTNPTGSVSNATADGGSSAARDHSFALHSHHRAACRPKRHHQPDGFRRHRAAVELQRRGRSAQYHLDSERGQWRVGYRPGGLISVFGTQLSPVNMATSEIPLPTALANSCLSVNGLPVPILFVSPDQVNAQMPFQAIGDVTLILRTPGGQSNNYNLVIEPNAPSVFLPARLVRKPTSPPSSATTTTNW